jgi:hypothetical protein
MDSAKFESMYSEADALQYSRVGSMPWEKIEPFLHRLPDREIDLLTLYRKYGKNQKDIARIFSVTQGAISSRLKRAGERLQFLRDLPKISNEEIERHLGPYVDSKGRTHEGVFSSLEIEIIKNMRDTTCQSETAKRINEKFGLTGPKERMTQVKVRHRFEKCINSLEALQKQKSDYHKFYHLLTFINANLYKLHEVVLPHFDRGARAVFSLKN